VGLAVSRAAHVVADSEATRNDLVARCRVPAERVTAIPLAADAHLRPVPAGAFRRQEGLERPYLLYLGTNKPHKNLVALVRAWGALPTTVRADYQLVVAGYQDARYPEARLLAAALGDSVRWLGPVAHADLAALYSGAQWFVFPSLYEGFGLPVLEAMACGTPVACSRASSLPEVVGEAGLTFDPRDEREMRAVLTRLLEDAPLRAQMAARALARAGQFSWEATARATYAVYRAVLGHKER
jgi:alpha-1,3-rhamnosyl/mannosyltransferase